MKNNRYHTCVKVCYSLGLEKELLPDSFVSVIPHSTASYWRKQDAHVYLGEEFSELVSAQSDELQVLYDKRVRCVKKGFIAICRVYLTLITIIGDAHFKKTITQNRGVVLDLIDRTSHAFGGAAFLCKALKIKFGTYKSWKRIQQYYCPSSLTELCFRKIPAQVSSSEIKTMKRMMNDARYAHWSTAAVWGYTVKQGLVTMSLSTWYKYSKLLELTPARKKQRKPRKKISVRAENVNDIWHMDVSQYKSLDHITFYIYTVIDNFSLKILAHDVSKVLSAEIRLESLKRAIEQEFDMNLSHQSLDLIVDGGSENNNHRMNNYIQKAHVNINKKIALKEVHFSNSVVEGNFKIMKQSYFQYRDILSDSMEQEVNFFVQDYNDVRPHYRHGIFTPNEVHTNRSFKDLKPMLQEAKKHRVEANRKHTCIMGCR